MELEMLTLLIAVVTNTTNFLLLSFVFAYTKSTKRETHTYIFMASVLALMAWSGANYFADSSVDVASGLLWTKLAFPPSLIMCLCIYWFSLFFPKRKAEHVWYLYIYAILCIVFSILTFTGGSIITSVSIDPAVGISDVVVGNLYLGILFLYIALIVHTTYNLVSKVSFYKGKERMQISYVLLGWSTFLFSAVITNAVLPLITGNAHWSKFGPIASVFMVGCIVYAILRHEFLDIKVVLQRGIIYSVLLALFITLYISLIFLARSLFTYESDISVIMSAFMTTVVGILATPRLVLYFKRVTNPWFFKNPYNYEEVIQRLAVVLNTNLDRDFIISETKNILLSALNISEISFTLGERKYGLIKGPILSYAVMSGERNIGTFALAEKRSGDLYTESDKHLLETFATQVGTALEKARLYEEVQEYAQMLEAKVDERTKEIQELQKDQELMMLEISHGLQTPLTIMKGELYLLRKQDIDTKNIASIDSSINRISLFIARILRLYASPHGYARVDELCDVGAIARGVVSLCEELAKGHNAQITLYPKENFLVRGNRDEIEELLSNLIENAIKYSDHNRQNQIEVSLYREDGWGVLKIEDSGLGISSEHVPRIFERFYRVGDSRSSRARGTGLGLAICKKIVTDHGGDISVKSTFGSGTTFTIHLPVQDT